MYYLCNSFIYLLFSFIINCVITVSTSTAPFSERLVKYGEHGHYTKQLDMLSLTHYYLRLFHSSKIEATIKMAETMAKKEITKITGVLVNKTLFTSKITMLSARKLFKKCANIGTAILSVLTYKMAMQIANINAAIMLP